MKVITDLQRKIKHLKTKKQKSIEEQKPKETENFGRLHRLKSSNIKTLLTKENNKILFSKEDEFMLKDTQKILFNYLDEECLLCGKDMINSTQVGFGDENDLEWELI